MPRYPDLQPYVTQPNQSAYSKMAARAFSRAGEIYPLHIGDTWLEPAPECRMEAIRVADHPGMHKYSPVQGKRSLRQAISDKLARTGDHPARLDEILVTAGATGGLYALMAALLQPGDEVLVIAPYWPLIGNAVECAGGRVVPVPFFESSTDSDSATECLDTLMTARTVAVYWNTPHNPTGRLIPSEWLKAMAAWAQKNNLWIVSDEVYEDYVYKGDHCYSRPLAPEQTISAYSFSKAYGMAGNRVGYLVGPAAVLSGYSASAATHSIRLTQQVSSQLKSLLRVRDRSGSRTHVQSTKSLAHMQPKHCRSTLRRAAPFYSSM